MSPAPANWRWYYPRAHAIAAEIRRRPALLALSPALLQADVRDRYGVGKTTAWQAVRIVEGAR